MTCLVDTSVLSEPARPAPNSRAVNWLEAEVANDEGRIAVTADIGLPFAFRITAA